VKKPKIKPGSEINLDMPQRDNKEESNYRKIVTFIKNPAIYKPVLFIFIFTCTPSTGSAMFYFMTNRLHFNNEFMGEIQLATAFAYILGIWIFNRFFRNAPFKKIFVFSAIICAIAIGTQILLVTGWNKAIGINDKVFCLTGNLLVQVFAELNAMPVLVLACRICPKNIEGTMYAFLMSTLNCGYMISNEWGALNTYLLGITETNFDNLWLLILISALGAVSTLPFIGAIDFNKAVEINEKEMQKTQEEGPAKGQMEVEEQAESMILELGTKMQFHMVK